MAKQAQEQELRTFIVVDSQADMSNLETALDSFLPTYDRTRFGNVAVRVDQTSTKTGRNMYHMHVTLFDSEGFPVDSISDIKLSVSPVIVNPITVWESGKKEADLREVSALSASAINQAWLAYASENLGVEIRLWENIPD
jgi:hypothetical protein